MNKPIVIVDADHLFYVVGYRMQGLGTDADATRLACTMLDTYLGTIRAKTGSDRLIVCISPPDHRYFRHTIYKFAPYKGTRPEKPEFFTQWEAVLRQFLTDNYQAQYVQGLEADDLLATAAKLCRLYAVSTVMCSQDKDTRQIPGEHLDPSRIEQKVLSQGQVTKRQAIFNFITQMLMGDDNDNIKGLPGVGEMKGQTLLTQWKLKYSDVSDDEELERSLYSEALAQYHKFFGCHYGSIIFFETVRALSLVDHREELHEINSTYNLVDLEQYKAYESYVLNQIAEHYEAEQQSVFTGTYKQTVGQGEPGPVLPAAPEQLGVEGAG